MLATLLVLHARRHRRPGHPGRGRRRAGAARVHDRRPRRRGAPGGARTGPRRDPQRRLQPSAAADHGQPRAGRSCARPAPRSTSRSRSGSSSARSRSASRRAGSRSSASCRSAARSGRSPGVLPMVAALARRGVRRVARAGGDGRRGAARRGHRRRRRGDAARGGRGRPTAAGARDAGRAAAPRARGRRRGRSRGASPDEGRSPSRPTTVPDLAEVRGQLAARRALEIALAGGHGLLLVGPPGSGKTLLARTIPGSSRRSTTPRRSTATIVASVAGEGPITRLRRRAPVRAPHHTLSYAAMVGGGPRLSPGEVTLAERRRPVPRRAAGVLARRARGAPPAARGRPRLDRPGRAGRAVPGPVPARRRDEPVPVRDGRRRVRLVHVRAGRPGALHAAASPGPSATGSTSGSRCRGCRPRRSSPDASPRARPSSPRGSRRLAARQLGRSGRLNGRLSGSGPARRVRSHAGGSQPGHRPGDVRGVVRTRHRAAPAGRPDDRGPGRGRRGRRASTWTRPRGTARPRPPPHRLEAG